jgi:hypothetical protein
LSPIPAACCLFDLPAALDHKILISTINAFFVLWDNTTRFVFTLAAAVIGLVCIYLIPGPKQIEEKRTGTYSRTGKYVIFILALLVLGIAGVLAWEWFRYHIQNLWVGGNMAVLAVLGAALFGGNIWTMRLVKQAEEHGEVVDVEVIELSAEDGTQPGLLGEVAMPAPPIAPMPPNVETSTNNEEAPEE